MAPGGTHRTNIVRNSGLVPAGTGRASSGPAHRQWDRRADPLFLTNLVLGEDVPINLLTVLICAIGGVVGWLVILVLHLLGVAFYVPA